MESVIVACVTGAVTLVGVLAPNSKSRAVMEFKIDALTSKVEKHNYDHRGGSRVAGRISLSIRACGWSMAVGQGNARHRERCRACEVARLVD